MLWLFSLMLKKEFCVFHYKNYSLDTRSYSIKEKMDIEVGDVVKSRYRARWVGKVVKLNPVGGCATVLQLKDQHNKQFRKPRLIEYHCFWFEVIERSKRENPI